MSAAEEFNDFLDDLDGDMLDGYHEYKSACTEPWYSFNGNHGQELIARKYIMPVAHEHAADSRLDWPWSRHPGQYAHAIFHCYDPIVIYRAFGETLDQAFDDLVEIWVDSMWTQWIHIFALEFHGSTGENDGPHPTHSVWRGNALGPTIFG